MQTKRGTSLTLNCPETPTQHRATRIQTKRGTSLTLNSPETPTQHRPTRIQTKRGTSLTLYSPETPTQHRATRTQTKRGTSLTLYNPETLLYRSKPSMQFEEDDNCFTQYICITIRTLSKLSNLSRMNGPERTACLAKGQNNDTYYRL